MTDLGAQDLDRTALLALNEQLLRRALDAEQALAAAVSGELDAVVLRESATPVLLHAAQERLRGSQQLLRAVFDSCQEAITLGDDNGIYLDVNPAALTLFDRPREDIIGHAFSELVVKSRDLATAFADFRERGTVTGQIRIRRPDGSVRVVDYSAVANVTPGVHLSVLRDITERFAAEEALRKNEALFRAVIEKSSEVISLTTIDGATRYLTPAAWQMLGWDKDEIGERTLREQVVPEDRARIESELARMVSTGVRDISLDLRVLHRDGTLRWLESTGTNLLDDPDVGAIVGNYRDITARKLAEDALRASELRYRRIVENTAEGVWMYDAAGLTTFMNARMAEMIGWTVEEVIGTSVFTFMDPANVEAARQRTQRRVRGVAERSDFELRRKDGSPLLVSISATPLFDADGTFDAALCLITDVSAQRRADEMRASLAAIVESSDDAIVGARLDGTITSWNRGAERIYQFRADEVIGTSMFVLIPAPKAADEREILRRVTAGESIWQYECERVRKDRSLVVVAVTVSPVRNEAGEVIGVSKIARDLTAPKKAEVAHRRVEEQFRQAQKMEAVGRLAGGVAHDFNNLLTVILSYSDFAIDDLKPGDPLRDDMTEIKQAAQRAATLTSQLLAFSRQQVLQPRVIDLNEIVGGMKIMLGRILGEDVELGLFLGDALGPVLADPGQIEQVVMNLAVNARDAMPDGGQLWIETSNVNLETGYVGGFAGVPAGSYVMVSVADTGAGMDTVTQTRIFEPFFTTKAPGKGTGLGLSTVFGIVQQSGGYLGVYSELGKGTTFKAYFPRTDQVADRLNTTARLPVLRGSETILLVEDEEQVRTVACAILRRNGYKVLETSNGGEALLISKEFPGTIHLLLTDVVMPRLSGRKLAEQLAEPRPAMKVLYTSGYTDDAILHHGVLGAGFAFLQKPFTPDTLLRRVRDVLEGTS